MRHFDQGASGFAASPANEPLQLDPMAIGIALAMRDNGFDDARIVRVLGYMPDLEVTLQDLKDYEASLDAP